MPSSSKHPILERGATGPDVRILQTLLQRRGYYTYRVDGVFGNLTHSALVTFQASHINPKTGKYLPATGVVDATTWAVLESSPEAQRQGLVGRIPQGLNPDRAAFLKLWAREHQNGTHEVPMGSNWGDGVTKFLEGVGPAPWCCYALSYLYKEATGTYPLGARHGHCLTFWRAATKAGLTYQGPPTPGDASVILYKDSGGKLTGSGHIFVTNNLGPDGRQFNTYGGNEGDRVKHGLRSLSTTNLVGNIRLFPEQKEKYERFLTKPGQVTDDSMGGTR